MTSKGREPVEDGLAPGTRPLKAPDANPTASAVIFGCEGPELSDSERDFFAETRPWGFILFARNIDAPDQVRRLTDALREAVGWTAPILIDQEGGRVARLRPPHWRGWAPVGDWTDAIDRSSAGDDDEAETALLDGLRLRYRMIAAELLAVGVDVDCAPLLDLRREDAHAIIGDRALGRRPDVVARRGRAIAEGLLSGGVLPVVKHMPGHGRAGVDSHDALPQVEAQFETLVEEDFAPFRALRDQALGMTAHVVYRSIDPDNCATLSPIVIGEVIRGEIGFDGLLMTDDLSMGALVGDFESRARDSLAAGCDVVLHCNGDMAEMTEAMRGVGSLAGEALRRAQAALAARIPPHPFDVVEAETQMAAIATRLGLAT